jgi:hypothetical protein
MPYFKRTNIFKSILFSRGMALGILLAIVFVSYGLVSLVGKSMDAARARKISEAQASNLKVKQEDLSLKLAALATPEGQEAALREKYPLVKAGEHVVVITDEESGSNVKLDTATRSDTKKGFWQFLVNLF